MTALPQHIDSTMMSCFRSCPQKYFREFVLGWRPSEVSIDLHAGGCFSEAMEVFNREFYTNGKLFEQARASAMNHFLRSWGDIEAPHKSPKTRDNVWLAFEDYLKTYPPLTDHVQPYFSEGWPTFEFTFGIPLTDSLTPGRN